MTGFEWDDETHTEELAYELFQPLFAAEQRRHERQQQEDWLKPHPRSPLATDDAALHPLAISHATTQLIVSGNDHMLTLSAVMRGPGGVLPAFGAYTLLRAAMETAAAALWSVGPEDAAQRRVNLLQWEWQSKADMVRFTKHLGREQAEWERDRLDTTRRLREVAANLSIPWRDVEAPLRSTFMLKAKHIPVRGLPPVAAWSAASAFAHGRPWSAQTLQQHTHLPSSTMGQARVSMTADARMVFAFAQTAHELLNHAEKVTHERGRAPKASRGVARLTGLR